MGMEDMHPEARKERLDVAMLGRGLVRSRSLASDLIKRGKVAVNGQKATKPSQDVMESDKIAVEAGTVFVSRAGEKLAHALAEWKVSVKGLSILDIGSSTGG